MSRKPKPGIDYAGWDIHIFEDDPKIDKLLDAQGWIGFAVYFYLCQRAYANGYFYRWSFTDSATTARKMAGGIKSETVKAAVGTCARVGLFDKRLLETEGILTSRGIQRGYVRGIEKRSFRLVDHRYWLLDEAETKAARISFFENESPAAGDSYAENADFFPENADFFPENGPNIISYDTIPGLKNKRAREEDDGFDQFWDAYPRKSGYIDKAYLEYLYAIEDGAKLSDMLTALEWQSAEWAKNGNQYAPSAEKWLHNRGWTQKRPKAKTPKGKKSLTFYDVAQNMKARGEF